MNEPFKPLTIEEEEELRQTIPHFIVAQQSGRATERLHIPGGDGKPVCLDHLSCNKTSKHSHKSWTEKDTETYPIGHKDVCLYCSNHYREMVDEVERVHVTTDNHSQTYHTNPDCAALSSVDPEDILSKPKHNIPTYEKCRVCDGGPTVPEELDENHCEHCGETYKVLADHLIVCERE